MSTWTEDRLSDYYAYYAEWPETIVRDADCNVPVNVESGCIKEPDMKATPMERTGFSFTVTSKFSMLKSDFDRVNLAPSSQNQRPAFKNHGFIWQVYRVGDDSPVDPIVDFWAGRKQ